ncbi:hypothetical protein PFISCL1PPCAC_25109, partial [Pristionchus fissidentatus]
SGMALNSGWSDDPPSTLVKVKKGAQSNWIERLCSPIGSIFFLEELKNNRREEQLEVFDKLLGMSPSLILSPYSHPIIQFFVDLLDSSVDSRLSASLTSSWTILEQILLSSKGRQMCMDLLSEVRGEEKRKEMATRIVEITPILWWFDYLDTLPLLLRLIDIVQLSELRGFYEKMEQLCSTREGMMVMHKMLKKRGGSTRILRSLRSRLRAAVLQQSQNPSGCSNLKQLIIYGESETIDLLGFLCKNASSFLFDISSRLIQSIIRDGNVDHWKMIVEALTSTRGIPLISMMTSSAFFPSFKRTINECCEPDLRFLVDSALNPTQSQLPNQLIAIPEIGDRNCEKRKCDDIAAIHAKKKSRADAVDPIDCTPSTVSLSPIVSITSAALVLQSSLPTVLPPQSNLNLTSRNFFTRSAVSDEAQIRLILDNIVASIVIMEKKDEEGRNEESKRRTFPKKSFAWGVEMDEEGKRKELRMRILHEKMEKADKLLEQQVAKISAYSGYNLGHKFIDALKDANEEMRTKYLTLLFNRPSFNPFVKDGSGYDLSLHLASDIVESRELFVPAVIDSLERVLIERRPIIDLILGRNDSSLVFTKEFVRQHSILRLLDGDANRFEFAVSLVIEKEGEKRRSEESRRLLIDYVVRNMEEIKEKRAGIRFLREISSELPHDSQQDILNTDDRSCGSETVEVANAMETRLTTPLDIKPPFLPTKPAGKLPFTKLKIIEALYSKLESTSGNNLNPGECAKFVKNIVKWSSEELAELFTHFSGWIKFPLFARLLHHLVCPATTRINFVPIVASLLPQLIDNLPLYFPIIDQLLQWETSDAFTNACIEGGISSPLMAVLDHKTQSARSLVLRIATCPQVLSFCSQHEDSIRKTWSGEVVLSYLRFPSRIDTFPIVPMKNSERESNHSRIGAEWAQVAERDGMKETKIEKRKVKTKERREKTKERKTKRRTKKLPRGTPLVSRVGKEKKKENVIDNTEHVNYTAQLIHWIDQFEFSSDFSMDFDAFFFILHDRIIDRKPVLERFASSLDIFLLTSSAGVNLIKMIMFTFPIAKEILMFVFLLPSIVGTNSESLLKPYLESSRKNRFIEEIVKGGRDSPLLQLLQSSGHRVEQFVESLLDDKSDLNRLLLEFVDVYRDEILATKYGKKIIDQLNVHEVPLPTNPGAES